MLRQVQEPGCWDSVGVRDTQNPPTTHAWLTSTIQRHLAQVLVGIKNRVFSQLAASPETSHMETRWRVISKTAYEFGKVQSQFDSGAGTTASPLLRTLREMPRSMGISVLHVNWAGKLRIVSPCPSMKVSFLFCQVLFEPISSGSEPPGCQRLR